MSTGPSQLRGSPTAMLPLGVRWLLLISLFLSQLLFITLRFDVRDIHNLISQSSYQNWSGLVEELSLLPQLAIALGTAVILFRRPGKDSLVSKLLQASRNFPSWWIVAIAQLGMFSLFYFLTGYVFEGSIWHGDQALLWLGAWLGCAFATFLLWLASLLPVSSWVSLVRAHGLPLGLMLTVAIITLAAGWATSYFWDSLARPTFWLVEHQLALFHSGIESLPDQFILRNSEFAVEVSPECSGYEGIGLVLAFLGIYLWFARHDLRFPQAWLLLPIGAVTIWLFNSLRITALMSIGMMGYRDIALGGFHSQAGWLSFNLVTLGLIAAAHSMNFFSTRIRAGRSTAGLSPTVAYLMPFLGIIAAQMVTAVFTEGYNHLYFVIVLVAVLILGINWKTYSTLRWTWSWAAVALGCITFLIWILLAPAPPEEDSFAEYHQLSPWAAAIWIAIRIFGAVVTVPLAEELAFRGYLMRRLVGTRFELVPVGLPNLYAIAITSVLFGLLHPGFFIAGSIAGLLFALAVCLRGELMDGVVAHAVANALLAVYVLWTGHYYLW